MIKERYVNIEVAMLLRDKCFNEPCRSVYEEKNLNITIYSYINSELSSGYVCAPTQQMACDWIEETFNINIVVYLTINGYLVCFCHAHKNPDIASYGIPDDDMPCGDNSDGSWSSKELAYNEALKFALTNLV